MYSYVHAKQTSEAVQAFSLNMFKSHPVPLREYSSASTALQASKTSKTNVLFINSEIYMLLRRCSIKSNVHLL